jgi:hypothetical protein
MGLDNGIEIKRKDNLPNCVLCFDNDEWRKQRGYDLEVAYWRKCWNVRHIIFDVLRRGDDNDSVIDITREELVEIIHRLEDDLHYFDFLEGEWGSCIWEWNDFRRIQKWNLKNLKKLAHMMKRHPEIEVIFYDSY